MKEPSMVPKADFTSYYGRPILKAPVWKDDIAYYFFLGGLAAGSSLLGAGAQATGRPALRRGSRVTALGAISAGTFYLIKDLGRPERFHHMLRIAKPTSPMSMGTWALAAYGGPMGIAAVSELMPRRLRKTLLGRMIQAVSGPSGMAAAALAPAVASYTAVLLSQTAVPAWHEAHEELPFIFTASACASAAGMGMILAPPSEAGPARKLALYGAAAEFIASQRMEARMGLLAEPFQQSTELKRASALTIGGALGGALFGRRSRVLAALSGLALLAGSLYERLGIFRAGVVSAKDPKYTVIPQRERLTRKSQVTGTG